MSKIKENIKLFVFMLIIVLGISYIVEFILWPILIWFGKEQFNWNDIWKLGFYLTVTCIFFIQDYIKKRVKKNV